MKYDKQAVIEGLKRTIEQNEEKIIEYSKPCDARKRRIRALERDLLKKKNKELEEKRPMVIYRADNQGAEIKGRVLQKAKIGDMYTVTVQNYGIFVVTQTNYESIKIGDEVRL